LLKIIFTRVLQYENMTWAAQRQIIYFSVAMTIILIVVGIPLYSLWHHTPTCFDGSQNGLEQGVDCGGICTRLCVALEINPVVVWQQAFQVEPGLYSAVVYIKNTKLNAESKGVPYTFTFRDQTNAIITERKGIASIPSGKNFAIFESNIAIPKNVSSVHTSFFFTGPIEWTRASKDAAQVTIQNQRIEGLTKTPTVTADLVNTSFNPIGRVDAIAIVYNTDGNAIAASKTYVDSIGKQASSQVVFTWPQPFVGQVTSCQQATDVMLDIDRSGSMSSDGKNPPQPLTSVKDAALSFVQDLKKGDQAGVISFATNVSSPIDQVLTNDKATLKDSIQSIAILKDGTQYTNISETLQQSISELTSNRHHDGAKQTIVLLTDGKPNKPEMKGDANYATNQALAAARSAQSQGIDIYTIGLGKDIDEQFLQSVAGLSGHFFKAPTSQDLQSVYMKIGAALCKVGPAKIEIIPELQSQ
jgi:Mg-chelatase subunit ChlD